MPKVRVIDENGENIGVLLTAVGIWTATSQRYADAEPPGGPARPADGRPKSKFRQVLDGLSFFN